jgi:hypothetical protein
LSVANSSREREQQRNATATRTFLAGLKTLLSPQEIARTVVELDDPFKAIETEGNQHAGGVSGGGVT